jgi:predicted nucleotidyltransferase
MPDSFDPSRLASELENRFPEVLFAYLFGSAVSGTIRTGGDIDVAVWIDDMAHRMDLIPEIIGLVESQTNGVDCDLIFLNNAGAHLAFEVLQGTVLFIREEARDKHALFYSRVCREYEDNLVFISKQLQYRGYEVQWNH